MKRFNNDSLLKINVNTILIIMYVHWDNVLSPKYISYANICEYSDVWSRISVFYSFFGQKSRVPPFINECRFIWDTFFILINFVFYFDCCYLKKGFGNVSYFFLLSLRVPSTESCTMTSQKNIFSVFACFSNCSSNLICFLLCAWST